ncbi:MAG TPA: hypothetical protein V6C65_04550 [Allocoleopsis sp.]
MSQIEKVPEIIDVEFVPTNEKPGELTLADSKPISINPRLKQQGQQCLDLLQELFPHEVKRRAPKLAEMVKTGDEKGVTRLQTALVKYKQNLYLSIDNSNTTNTSIAATTNNNQVTHNHEGDRIVYVQPVYNVTYAPVHVYEDHSSYYNDSSYYYEDNSCSGGGGGWGGSININNTNSNSGGNAGGGRGGEGDLSWNIWLWGFVGVMFFVLCASLARSLSLDPMPTSPNHPGTVRIQP